MVRGKKGVTGGERGGLNSVWLPPRFRQQVKKKASKILLN